MHSTPTGSGVTHSHMPKPAPMLLLVGVFVSLLALTAITVAVAYVDLGELNLVVAMGVATIKALLVSLFFMHLAHDSGFNRLAFFGSFLFVALFVGITLMDSGQYQSQIDWNEKVLPEEAGQTAP